MMNATQMIELMNRVPFEPFEIHLTDGARVRVEEPYHISTFQNSPTCTVYDTDERARIISYRNITEVITAAQAG